MPLPGRLRGTLALTALSLVLAGSLATSAWALPDFDGDGAVAPQDCNPLDGAVAPGRPDAPDLAFEDTNCDGIDGDVARAVFVSLGGSNARHGLEGEPAADHRQRPSPRPQAAGQGRLRRRRHVHGVRRLADGVGLFGGYTPVTGARSASEVTTIAGVRQGALADGATGVVLQQLTLARAPARRRRDSSTGCARSTARAWRSWA